MYVLFRPDRESDSEAEGEHGEKLRQVKAVLEEVVNSLNQFCILFMSLFSTNNLILILTSVNTWFSIEHLGIAYSMY